MASTDLKGDAINFFSEHGSQLLAVGAALVVGALLLGLVGFGNALGGVFFLGSGLLWIAAVGFVLWMLYRLVLAVERIAGAQERIASAQFQAELEDETNGESKTAATVGEPEGEEDSDETGDETA